MKKGVIQKMKQTLSEIRNFICSDSNIKSVYSYLSNEELLFMAKNKKYADDIRYENKDDLNESLANPKLIDIKIGQIRKMFKNGVEDGCSDFLVSLLNDIRYLEQTFVWGANAFDKTEDSCIAFWEQAYAISTLDNASAMCFASDTWEFYIFELILEKLTETYPSNKPFDYKLLTAGMMDVRTKVYHNRFYLKSSNEIEKVLSEKDIVGSDGIMPLFLLAFKQAEGLNGRQPELANLSGLSENFLYWFEIYSIMYECKILYETFEYFGKYEFLRHLAIMKTFNILNAKNSDKAQEFKYLASTYQYDRALEILKKEGN